MKSRHKELLTKYGPKAIAFLLVCLAAVAVGALCSEVRELRTAAQGIARELKALRELVP